MTLSEALLQSLLQAFSRTARHGACENANECPFTDKIGVNAEFLQVLQHEEVLSRLRKRLFQTLFLRSEPLRLLFQFRKATLNRL